jgi:hypothetical protein
MIRIMVPIAIALLAAAQASSALAQAGQTPPQGQAARDQTPKPPECISQNDDFTNHQTFEVTLTNGCEQRFRCTVRAYVVNSRGPT